MDTMNTETQTVRMYYRCLSCLEPMAAEGGKRPEGAACPFCGGARFEYMGRVVRDNRLVTDHELCACDGRCTNATGPSCDCSCGGKNHGTQRTVWVVRDAGAVPEVRTPSPEAAEKAARRVVEFAAAAKAMEERVRARGGWNVADGTRHYLYKASKLKTHKGRIAYLEKIAAEKVAA